MESSEETDAMPEASHESDSDGQFGSGEEEGTLSDESPGSVNESLDHSEPSSPDSVIVPEPTTSLPPASTGVDRAGTDPVLLLNAGEERTENDRSLRNRLGDLESRRDATEDQLDELRLQRQRILERAEVLEDMEGF